MSEKPQMDDETLGIVVSELDHDLRCMEGDTGMERIRWNNRAMLLAVNRIEALRNPCIGDIESQAAAWSAVWKELENVGILSFVATCGGGRERAVQFIRHLAAKAESADNSAPKTAHNV